MTSELLDRYLELRTKLHSIQEEMDRLKPEVVSYVSDLGGKLDYAGVQLLTQVSKSWQFSQEVMLLENILKDKKRDEIESGKATPKKETTFVIVRRITQGHDFTTTRTAFPRAYTAWTEEEVLSLQRRFEQGYSIQELSAFFQRQVGGIRARLRRLGLID